MKLKFNKIALLVAMLPVMAMAEGPSAAAGGRAYNPVTDARLQNPEARNWLSTRGNYAGWGYSPLDKINEKKRCKDGPGLVVFDRRAGRSPVPTNRQRRLHVHHNAG